MTSELRTGNVDLGRVVVRAPRIEDVAGIAAVVKGCVPFLTSHISYIYWMTVRCHGNTCAVAEENGDVVGWCSVAHVSGGKYFSHQTAVAPRVRGRGIAQSLWAYVLSNLSRPEVELEFTLDRRNDAALKLMTVVAQQAGMQLIKRPEPVELVEDGVGEELYVMVPARNLNRFGSPWRSDATGFHA